VRGRDEAREIPVVVVLVTVRVLEANIAGSECHARGTPARSRNAILALHRVCPRRICVPNAPLSLNSAGMTLAQAASGMAKQGAGT
jgi:hypothetical protein